MIAMAIQATASPGQSTAPTLQSTARAVALDVAVTDKNGMPISNLTKTDFTVLEDGQPQKIVSFQAVDRGVVKDGSTVDAGSSKAGIILVLDDAHTRFTDMASARQTLSKILGENKSQLIESTMLLAFGTEGMVMLHDYTRDGNALKEALRNHQPGLGYPLHGAHSFFPSLLQVAQSSRDITGPKTVVLVTSGLSGSPPSSISSVLRAQPGIAARAKRESGQLLRARITFDVIDPRAVGEHNVPDSGIAAESFAAEHGSIPSIHGGGVGETGPSRYQPNSIFDVAQELDTITRLERVGGSAAAGGGSEALALETGGVVAFNGNDVKKEVEQSMVRGATYYSILYHPTNTPSFGQFHKIEVRTNTPGATIHTRNGYYVAP
jgi:VWFA-related protein